VRAGIVGVQQVEVVRMEAQGQNREGIARQPFLAGGEEQWRSVSRKQQRLVAGVEQAAVEAENLPLTTAHFASAIEV
jgi:hypothetical protein